MLRPNTESGSSRSSYERCQMWNIILPRYSKPIPPWVTHHKPGLPLAVSQKKWLKRSLLLKLLSMAVDWQHRAPALPTHDWLGSRKPLIPRHMTNSSIIPPRVSQHLVRADQKPKCVGGEKTSTVGGKVKPIWTGTNDIGRSGHAVERRLMLLPVSEQVISSNPSGNCWALSGVLMFSLCVD